MAAQLRHTSVIDAIGADIVSGALAPNEVITLEQLQERYKVSRGIARECMRVLESMGMLQSQRRTGIRVQPLEHWKVNDPLVIRWRLEGPGHQAQLQALTELRLGLEPVAARLAAIRATEDERIGLREIAAMMRVNAEAGRSERHLEADLKFHTQVLEASHNEIYAAMANLIREVLIARRRQGLIHDANVPAALDQHELVAQRIADGDPEGAETAMHDLLSEVRAELEADSAPANPRPAARGQSGTARG
ncbi:MAG: FCD domain-containing protein [Propionibacteriaceae bacterium]|jgi:DNA-binding FadR family transcriptional regulator|nr:FCD domain-containing protein [Propionibacteriaceae bacterium]